MTDRNASVLCQSECPCLHKTVNMVVFFVKHNENTYQKGRALMNANVQSCPSNKDGIETWFITQLYMFSMQYNHYEYISNHKRLI